MKVKVVIYLLIVILLLTPLQAFAQEFRYGSITTKEEMAVELLEILNRHSPTIKNMLDLNASEDGELALSIIMEHVPDGDFDRLFYYLSEVAHYRAHNWHKSEVVTLMDSSGEISRRFVSNTKHFLNDEVLDFSYNKYGIVPTGESLKDLSSELQTFRFDKYVGVDTDVMSANAFGAYGLLQEWDAYFKGLQVVVDSAPYFMGYFDEFSLQHVFGYFSVLQSDILGVYEFLFWTLEYMLYLQNNYPEQYQLLIEDPKYIKAFSYFYEQSILLIEVEIPTLKRRIFQDIMAYNFSGVKAEERGGVFTISYSNNGSVTYSDVISFGPGEESVLIREHLRDAKYVNLVNSILGDLPNLPSRWARESIAWAESEDLVPSNLKSIYRKPITRAEFCSLAVLLYERVSGREIIQRLAFNDTTDINVQKIGGLGIVNGIGDGNFGPDLTISRQQAAVILTGIASQLGKRAPKSSVVYTDSSDISQWARDGVGQVYALGVMSSVGNNQFNPRGEFTREQSITTMLRLFELF